MNLLTRLALTLSALILTIGMSPSAQAAQGPEPILGPGDLIRVSVYQNPDLTLETKVSEAGGITFPLIGEVMVGGSSIATAQATLAGKLREGNFVLKPQVNIMLVQVRSSQVSVLGQVGRPGRYPIESAKNKVSEMIALAGGVLPQGYEQVTLMGRRGGKPYKVDIDLNKLLVAGQLDLDLDVEGGDTLYVDRIPNLYVYGEVQRPGQYRLERGMTVLQALAGAGGLTQKGTERGLRVERRADSGEFKTLRVEMNDLVQRDDVIRVRESLF
jgi:polysaccharide export outer membrane protein